MRLEHVNLTVADVERSIEFYDRLLGLRVRWKGFTSGGQPAAHVGDDQWYIALFEGEPRPIVLEYEKVGYNHFGVVVDDLDEAVARVRELGASVHLQSDAEPGRRAYFLDPDGYEVELVEYAAA
jgi:catechol 2,3-dioxygenase-like lactoylglutathione lyase family enzyme